MKRKLSKEQKTIKRLKARIDKLRDIVWWLTDGNQNLPAVESEYDEFMKEQEREEREFEFYQKMTKK